MDAVSLVPPETAVDADTCEFVLCLGIMFALEGEVSHSDIPAGVKQPISAYTAFRKCLRQMILDKHN
eukprot:1732131-Alexandrium_andersonii.AAC.1